MTTTRATVLLSLGDDWEPELMFCPGIGEAGESHLYSPDHPDIWLTPIALERLRALLSPAEPSHGA